MTAKVEYKGALRTSATHLASGSTIETDAPVDNHGKGERFSPTDLVATALATCMLTIMGIVAERDQYDITGATCEVTKIMASDPRRIGKVVVSVHMPANAPADAKARTMLERAAHTCPVFQSLHADMEKEISFYWAGAQNA